MAQTQEARMVSGREKHRWRDPEQRLPRPLRFLYNHSISIAMLTLFALSLMAQSITGYRNQPHAAQTGFSAYVQYIASDDFLETMAENWEGEFLPLTAYIFFTSFLHERGAKESRQPNERRPEKTDEDPAKYPEPDRKDVPWPVRVGGPVAWIYMHSLLLGFLLIFLAAVATHALTGLGTFNSMLALRHEPSTNIFGYMASNTFWLQSTRNWEAGFFSTAMLAVFSIFLREKGSPVSKVGDQPDKATGEEESAAD